ncbi:hypothetical protein CGZ80_22035 [Rhodopirellula sp. MGV]|nr:hypothetical protein CGZ80_22035 [Rhodopirellula sp. MGV]
MWAIVKSGKSPVLADIPHDLFGYRWRFDKDDEGNRIVKRRGEQVLGRRHKTATDTAIATRPTMTMWCRFTTQAIAGDDFVTAMLTMIVMGTGCWRRDLAMTARFMAVSRKFLLSVRMQTAPLRVNRLAIDVDMPLTSACCMQ